MIFNALWTFEEGLLMSQAARDTLDEFPPGELFHLKDKLCSVFQDDLMVGPKSQNVAVGGDSIGMHFQIVFPSTQVNIQHTKRMCHRVVIPQFTWMSIRVSIGT